MIKVLFLIHDLGQGGAEKVLVNLVNNLDLNKFDVTVISLFAGGVNEQFLSRNITYKTIYNRMIRGNSKLMKLLSPKNLHKLYIKDTYDIEISYLEGPCARIISGCNNKNTKLVSWIHVEQHTMDALCKPFRSKNETNKCYNKFDRVICVSEYVKNDFISILNYRKPCDVIYNTIETDQIVKLSKENIDIKFEENNINLIAVGTLKRSKGYNRLLSVVNKLIHEGINIKLYVLGIGPLKDEMLKYIKEQNIAENVILIGYDVNPYKYVAKADLFVCASYSEGFSTAATESLIVGTPVCTVDVSGMKEMLGKNNEYGIVTENNEEALYEGIKMLALNNPLLKYYKKKAEERGKFFMKKNTVKAVEEMLGLL